MRHVLDSSDHGKSEANCAQHAWNWLTIYLISKKIAPRQNNQTIAKAHKCEIETWGVRKSVNNCEYFSFLRRWTGRKRITGSTRLRVSLKNYLCAFYLFVDARGQRSDRVTQFAQSQQLFWLLVRFDNDLLKKIIYQRLTQFSVRLCCIRLQWITRWAGHWRTTRIAGLSSK